MFKDIADAGKAAIVDRFSSPIFGSFAIAWSLWNYKFLVILFSQYPIRQTFSLIDEMCFPGWEQVAIKGFLLPFFSAAAYIFVYPFPERWVYKFGLKMLRVKNDIRREIDEETPIDKAEARKLRLDMRRIQTDRDEQVGKLLQEVEDLRLSLAANESKTKEVKPPDSAAEKSQGLSIDEVHVLRTLGGLEGSAHLKDLRVLSKLEKVEFEYALDELVRHGLVRSQTNGRGEQVARLTQPGRQFVIKSKGERHDAP